MDERLRANRDHWDEAVGHHTASGFYDVAGFKAGCETLDRLETAAVGPVAGKRLLHLQCHFGLDTLSWVRRGARATGLDFSGEAIGYARSLAAELGLSARFVHAEVTAAAAVLGETFDVVFTSYGVLCWLPELAPWGRAVADCLRPGGRFALVESHPAAMVFDDEDPAELRVRYPYFQRGALRFDEDRTYACDAQMRHRTTYEWMHPLEEIVSALLGAGLRLVELREYPVAAWRMFPFLERDREGSWRLPDGRTDIPLTLSIVALKPR